MITTPVNRQFVHPPRHGLKAEGVTPATPGEKNKTSLLTFLKVANRSRLEVETLLGGAATPQGDNVPPQGVQGRSPGTPLVPFVVKRKEPKGVGRAGPLVGAGATSRGC